MYDINKPILAVERNDYAEHLSNDQVSVDCSLGTNPYGACPDLDLTALNPSAIVSYPEDEASLKTTLVDHYSTLPFLTADHFLLSCGSMGALLTINRAFLREGKTVLGVAPQFTAMIDDMRLYGALYKGVPLNEGANYQFELSRFLEALEGLKDSLVYIDNPNNPTGQIIPIAQLKAIIEQAQKQNTLVIVDEAYGDYMPVENSALQLIDNFDNLIVTRTFSKGLGAAGMRLGYMAGNPKLMAHLQKVALPFAMNQFANVLAQQILSSPWMNDILDRVITNKRRFLSKLNHLKVSTTADSVPIALYYTEDTSIDLEQYFLKAGMRVVSCQGYENLGPNHVRINLAKDIEAMETALAKVEQALTEASR